MLAAYLTIIPKGGFTGGLRNSVKLKMCNCTSENMGKFKLVWMTCDFSFLKVF